MGSHHYFRKIYYHDTDCGGVVYYANYLKYMEEARTEALLQKGISLKDLALRGLGFMVRKVSIEYKHPAQYQDEITVITDIVKVKMSMMQLNQVIYKQDILLVQAETIIVLVDKDLKSVSIPNDIKTSIFKSKTDE